MIDEYEQDLPKLSAGLKASGSKNEYPSPESLRDITRQGCKHAAPLCGYSTSTEGSQWIVECARRADSRPLWVLVWGALEDVAQALHDAPDIAGRIRVYWIGGPNKKWGCNAYNYIAENFPGLWFIENNATYRGFIGSAKDTSTYQSAYWETFMKDAGVMGNDFINYYDGIVKMGDTPSLLYLMNGNPDTPGSDHWGGSFEPMSHTPKYIVTGPLCIADTVPAYSLMEWHINGPDTGIASDRPCFTLHIDKQDWDGYHIGGGVYAVRYAPKAPASLPYTISSDIPGFPVHEGTFTVGDKWPAIGVYTLSSGNITSAPLRVGDSWYTDIQEYSTRWQGTSTIARWRDDIMRHWAGRFNWLRR